MPLWRHYLSGLLLGALALAVGLGGGAWRVWGEYRQEMTRRSEILVERLDERLRFDLEEIVSDVRYLADRAELQDLLYDQGHEALVAHLEEDFRSFSEHKRRYDQVRYIDADGAEVVRVNLTADGPRVVPADELQGKAQRYYFSEAMALAPGEIYVSAFDLNIEHGEVETPHKPMIRVATPIPGGRGVVVLNYLGARLIEDLRQMGRGFPGRAMLVNHQGHYLWGGNGADWAFMFGAPSPGAFAEGHPRVWSAAGESEGGLLLDERGIYRFRRIPLLPGAPPAQGRDVILVGWLPAELLRQRSEEWLKGMAAPAGVVYALFALGLWFYLTMRRRQREGEARLAASAAGLRKLQRAVEQSPVSVVVTDLDGVIQYVNPWFVEVTGYSAEEAVGQTPRVLKSGAHDEAFYEALWHTILRGEVWRGEIVNRKKSGECYWEAVSISPVRDEAGEITNFVAVKQDISERKRAEEALARLSRQNQRILEAVGDGVYGVDRNGDTTFFNPAAAHMTGWAPEEIIGRHQHALIHHSHANGTPYPDEACPIYATLRDGRERRVIGEVFWRADGGAFPVEYVATPIIEEGEVLGSVVVFRDISERLESEGRLVAAKREAEAANRAKSRFLAAMSHDIRTPMNTILGMGELLAEGGLEGEMRHYLGVSNRAGEALLALINDILDFSKIEAGQFVLEHAPLDPRELVTGTVEIVAHVAEAKGLAVETRIDPALPARVTGDGARLRQVLLNLLSNAVKFTERGGITVEVVPEGEGRIHFSVADSGIGVPDDRLSVIFDPFVQAEDSTSRRFGGTGLGLAICKGLVEQMGGTVGVESAVGEGSRFHFMVPLPTADGEVPTAVVRKAERPAVEMAGRSILVVDDAEDNRLLVGAFLKGSPHRLTFAENGREALERFEGGAFDLVLMDLQMPEMDGFEATRRIRALEAERGLKPTPIVALTAHAMREQKRESLAAGCDYHLTKPLKKRRLLEVIALYGERADEG